MLHYLHERHRQPPEDVDQRVRSLLRHLATEYTGAGGATAQQGAGREDTGRYTVYGLADDITLYWRYQVIRLWELAAEDLLQLEQPALAALVGLTRLSRIEEALPRVLHSIRSVPDRIERQRLLTALVTLLPTEEVTQMVEKLLEDSEALLLDTPYLRRMRELGRQEGVQIGREEGLQTVRAAILEGAAHKFDPTLSDYRQLQHHLEQIHQLDGLQQILLTLLDAPDIGVMLQLAEKIAGAA